MSDDWWSEAGDPKATRPSGEDENENPAIVVDHGDLHEAAQGDRKEEDDISTDNHVTQQASGALPWLDFASQLSAGPAFVSSTSCIAYAVSILPSDAFSQPHGLSGSLGWLWLVVTGRSSISVRELTGTRASPVDNRARF